MNSLVGQTICHVWTTGPWVPSGYAQKLLTPTELRWTGISGKRRGLSEVVSYHHLQLSPTMHQFSWIEKPSNLHKVLVYDFANRIVSGVLFDTSQSMYVLTGVMTDERGTPLA